MNFAHLKYVVEIANTNSISKAAENLYMNQPNLSRAIKSLENELGIVIFTRSSKGIKITPEGEEFIQYARKIINQVDDLESMYKEKRTVQKLSVCVPRASYMSYAISSFAKKIKLTEPVDIYYRESNSMRAINEVVLGNYNMGIIRYQDIYAKDFKRLFMEKRLESYVINEFSYTLVMSKTHPLAKKENIRAEELTHYIEIAHADPYVPNMPLIDVKKNMAPVEMDKIIYVYERASQYDLLQNVEGTFMWMSPVSDDYLSKFDLIQKKCDFNDKIYKDAVIYRKGYKLTALEKLFLEEASKVKELINYTK